jgi:hypothetical protein
MRKLLGSLLFALAAGCSVPAHADQSIGPQMPGSQIAIGIAPAKMRAPYDVQVIREGGEALPTYALKDRFYVQGNAGERYVIRVTNPTPNRVEAVVTVDGLDVIDGEAGDLRKRGYVVPAYGEVRIEGFRTSQSDVATFRFSSVNDSYAGQKGKARNVGVIAVAIFEEQRAPEQQIIVEERPPMPRPTYRGLYDGGHGVEESDASASAAPKKSAMKDESRAKRAPETRPAPPRIAPAEAPATATRPAPLGVRRPAPPAPPPVPGGGGAPVRDAYDEGDDFYEPAPAPETAQRSHRPGLGTEFGEQRYSAASYTRFVRGQGRPIAIAELRYNDAPGLMALGIALQPLPDTGEIMTRETADPFPGDDRFARPPGR